MFDLGVAKTSRLTELVDTCIILYLDKQTDKASLKASKPAGLQHSSVVPYSLWMSIV